MKQALILLLLTASIANAKLLGNPTVEEKAYFEKIANRIYVIEGGAKTKYPYGIKSVKVANIQEARRVCINTVRNNYFRWQAKGSKGDYLEFLANVYCPIGAKDDPKGLNKNWLRNLRAGLTKEI